MVLLDDIADAFHLSELISTKEINVDIDTFFHGRNFGMNPSEVQEGVHIASAEDSGKALA